MNPRHLILTLFCSFFCGSKAAPANFSDFSQKGYEQTKRIVVKILDNYDPAETIFVGVGRSPVAVIAFLQVLGIEALNFPLSRFRAQPEGLENRDDQALSRRSVDSLFAHFDYFFPNIEDMKNKTIVFIDYVHDGYTYRGLLSYFEEYLKVRGLNQDRTLKVRVFGITQRLRRVLEIWYRDSGKAFYLFPSVLEDESTRLVFLLGYYKKYAEYGRYHDYLKPPANGYRPPTRRPQFEFLKTLIQGYLLRDPEFLNGSLREKLFRRDSGAKAILCSEIRESQ